MRWPLVFRWRSFNTAPRKQSRRCRDRVLFWHLHKLNLAGQATFAPYFIRLASSRFSICIYSLFPILFRGGGRRPGPAGLTPLLVGKYLHDPIKGAVLLWQQKLPVQPPVDSVYRAILCLPERYLMKVQGRACSVEALWLRKDCRWTECLGQHRQACMISCCLFFRTKDPLFVNCACTAAKAGHDVSGFNPGRWHFLLFPAIRQSRGYADEGRKGFLTYSSADSLFPRFGGDPSVPEELRSFLQEPFVRTPLGCCRPIAFSPATLCSYRGRL